MGIDYCLIGGMAVNAYCEPVVSMDLDIVIALEAIASLRKEIKNIYVIEEFTHSINLSNKNTSLRIQIQTDTCYQSFIKSALVKDIMGYKMMVARVEDVLQGKIWAYSDKERRQIRMADNSRHCFLNIILSVHAD